MNSGSLLLAFHLLGDFNAQKALCAFHKRYFATVFSDKIYIFKSCTSECVKIGYRFLKGDYSNVQLNVQLFHGRQSHIGKSTKGQTRKRY